MEYEIYQVSEDGSKVAVTADKVNDAIAPTSVLIFIDHTHRKIYNFNGRESSIRARFCGARLAAGPIRGELGLSYSLSSIDEGEETGDFRELLKNISVPGNAMVTRILERPPPPPLPLKRSAPKETVAVPKPAAAENENNMTSTQPAPQLLQKDSPNPSRIDLPTDLDMSFVVKEFGELPDGYDVEAMIIKGGVYKCVEVQTKVFGKQMDQTRVERVRDVDGIFTLDGQIRVVAKNGVVDGIQILTKQKSGPSRKPKQAASE
jgi:hypothetical protein